MNTYTWLSLTGQRITVTRIAKDHYQVERAGVTMTGPIVVPTPTPIGWRGAGIVAALCGKIALNAERKAAVEALDGPDTVPEALATQLATAREDLVTATRACKVLAAQLANDAANEALHDAWLASCADGRVARTRCHTLSLLVYGSPEEPWDLQAAMDKEDSSL